MKFPFGEMPKSTGFLERFWLLGSIFRVYNDEKKHVTLSIIYSLFLFLSKFNICISTQLETLGGGFKYFLIFTPNLGEMIQFD